MEFADETPIRRLEVVRARRDASADLGRLYAHRPEASAGVAASICGDSAPTAVHDAFVRAGSQQPFGWTGPDGLQLQ